MKEGERLSEITDSRAYKYARYAAAEGNAKIPRDLQGFLAEFGSFH